MSELEIERVPVGKESRTDTDSQVKELSSKLTDAENEIARLREAFDNLQEEYDKAITIQRQLDYRVENQKGYIDNLGKTLETLTIENRHLKGLVKLWIGEQ